MAEAYAEAEARYSKRRSPIHLAATYGDDPVAFVHDCIRFPEGEAPAPYQEETLAEWAIHKRAAVRGPHGIGKTTTMSWAILWGVLCAPDVKVPTTASAWRQLTKYLWPEVHKWARRLDWGKLRRDPFGSGELQVLSMRPGPTQEAFAVATNNPDLIEGAHANRIVYVYDEAKAIPHEIWDATEGAFATGEAFALAMSTPGGQASRFYQICSRRPGYEDWWTRHVTVGEAIKAGRISPDWVEQRRRQWGEDSPVFQARVLGEFPDQSEDSLIALSWIEAAREASLEPTDDRAIGVDVARYGNDDSVLIPRDGPVVAADVGIVHGQDTMSIAGMVKASGYPASIDVIGVGSGVYDRLREQEYDAVGINVGASAIESDHFANLRAELYWLLRERFKSGAIDLSRLPHSIYDRLSGELTSMKFSYSSKGQIKLMPKADMKQALGYSPDVADALMLAFAPRRAGRLLMSDEEYTQDA